MQSMYYIGLDVHKSVLVHMISDTRPFGKEICIA